MKLKGRHISYIAIMVVMLALVGSSLAMKEFAARLLPFLFGSAAFVVAAIGLTRDLLSERKSKAGLPAGEETAGKHEVSEGWRGYLVNGAWIVAFALGIFLLGFLVAVPLFILFYSRRLGARWLAGVLMAVVMTALVYGVFQVGLGIDLFRGVVLGRFG